MDELQKAVRLGMGESVTAAKVVADFRRQCVEWGCALPDVQFLVSDFGLNDFYRTGLVEAWIANETKAGYCGKYLFVFDGQRCPNHKHMTKQETFFVVKGQVEMEYDNVSSLMNPGDALTVYPGKFHTFVGRGPALLLELSMPCVVDDNFFADPDIPYGLNCGGKKC